MLVLGVLRTSLVIAGWPRRLAVRRSALERREGADTRAVDQKFDRFR
jgi:hypothetical protein